MPGDRFNARGITNGAGFRLFTECPIDVADIEAVKLSPDASQVVTDIGESAFNEIFRSCPVVQYERNGAVHSLYKRVTPIPEDFNAYKMFTYTWENTANNMNVDFEMFSSVDDLTNGVNQWVYCNYNDPDVGYPRDCGRNGWVANEWFSMPGDRFNARGITNGAGFKLFTECPIDFTTIQAVELSSDASQVLTDIGETAFNEIFRSCPVVQYERNGAVHSVYKRVTPIPDNFNAYRMFTYTWQNTPANNMNVDFEMFSSLDDLANDANQWVFCNYNDPDVGYPRDCGQHGGVGNQWFSMPGDRFNARGITNGAGFKLFIECPIEFANIEAVKLSWDASRVLADIGETAFNEIFQSCPVVQYERNGAVHSLYKRVTPIPADFNAYKMFTYTWQNTPANTMNVDFELFSSLDDLTNDVNQWVYCNYNDPDVGYPRDCGRQGWVANEWFSMPGDRFNARGITNGAGFKLFKDCPIEFNARRTLSVEKMLGNDAGIDHHGAEREFARRLLSVEKMLSNDASISRHGAEREFA